MRDLKSRFAPDLFIYLVFVDVVVLLFAAAKANNNENPFYYTLSGVFRFDFQRIENNHPKLVNIQQKNQSERHVCVSCSMLIRKTKQIALNGMAWFICLRSSL